MIGYCGRLAFQNLRRHAWLTALIVLAISIGMGSSMTVYSILRAMSSDPIPAKSSLLLTPQFDNFGPDARPTPDLPVMLSYRDVAAWHRDRPALRQAGMYEIGVAVASAEATVAPVPAAGRATHADFFAMFEVPIIAGRAWTAEEDAARANVVVLARSLATQLFADGEAVGKTVQVEGSDYGVVGVIAGWEPSPRFYDVGTNGGSAYDEHTTLYMPLETALDRGIQTNGSVTCLVFGSTPLKESECVWLQYWMEVGHVADIRGVREYLGAYAAEQQRAGRFTWKPITRVHDVRQWLVHMKVAPDELRVATWLAFAFLFVCLVNATALMLARSSRRNAEFSVRRALGASRRHLFMQGMAESLVVGLVGGLVGIVWTWGGLAALRALVPEAIRSTTRFAPEVLGQTLLLALFVTLLAGLYPAWRASRVSHALALKSS